MMSFIVQKFIGMINSIEIKKEQLYYTLNYILEQIEEKFGECYTDEFVEDLYLTIDNAYLKYDSFDFETFERSLEIYEVDRFEDIIFNYEGLTYKFDELNENIKCGKYIIGDL